MTRFRHLSLLIAAAIMVLAAAAPASAQGINSIVNSKHNLSVGGPGTIKAVGEVEVCVFCHTPHNATPVQPLWNRSMPSNAYKPYTSNSLKAKPGQPTGSSKLCLSCHDGTIALGSVKSRDQQIQMANGVTVMPAGAKGNLGTDLSDDHPISFKYDGALVTSNPKLKQPSGLPSSVKLDSNSELQCVTCHDAHNNQYGAFLVMSNNASELCNSCHVSGGTTITEHTPCANCHKTHTAPSGPYLLTKAKVNDTCLTCHSGAGGAGQGPNINADILKSTNHDTSSPVNLANHIPDNVDCKDCHEQHSMKTTSGTAPAVQGSLGTIDGVTITSAVTKTAQYEYEVCLKCHGDNATTKPPLRVSRQIVQANKRLQFESAAVSFHPVAAVGKNTNVPSLRPGWTTTSRMYCSDCHGSETSKKAGGTGPNGPHGSTWPGMLLARYDTGTSVSYAVGNYALCWRCHDSTKVISENAPFKYHKKHVQEKSTPCSVCHDSHGIASAQGNTTNNFAMINFDTTACKPDSVTKKLAFEHTTPNHGRCYVLCHSKNHSGLSY